MSERNTTTTLPASLANVESPEDAAIRKLRAELAVSREREKMLIKKLTYVLQQNDLDMLLTGEEIRECRTILDRLNGSPPKGDSK